MSARALELFLEARNRNMDCTIELDCPPGGIRPGDLLLDVIKDTGLPVRDPIYKCFGNWCWDYKDMPDAFKAAKPLLKERIEKLYHSGTIRYGSW